MTKQNNDRKTSNQDLKDRGKEDIIPENEEYYTLDLRRDFDGLKTDDDTSVDIAGENPLEEDDTAEVVKSDSDKDTIDEDNAQGAEVGEAGHWGVDEGTD